MFDIKIVILVCDDLLMWQCLNVIVFLVIGIVVVVFELLGVVYVDVNGWYYVLLCGQFILIFVVDLVGLQVVYCIGLVCELMMVVYVFFMFVIGYDEVNCQVFLVEDVDNMDLVGIVLCGLKKGVEKVIKGLMLYL